MSPVLAGVFILYYRTNGEILWAKTAVVNALIWASILAILLLLRWLATVWVRAHQTTSEPFRPEVPAEPPSNVRTTTRPRSSPDATDSSTRHIRPDGGSPIGPALNPPQDASGRLRVSMGRGSGQAAETGTAGGRAEHRAVAVCRVCATVVSSPLDPCPVCGEAGST